LTDIDLRELTSGIVSAYVAKNPVPPSGIPDLVSSVAGALAALKAPKVPEPVVLTPPVPIRKSVTPDFIISLEDGKPYRTLKRHLAGRGLSPDEYREKWGLPRDYPMVAPNYATRRSELAKAMGLGHKPAPVPEPVKAKRGRAKPK
jgi:predicted transcriptional regulator